MEYTTSFEYKNAIIVDAKMLREIEKEILKYCKYFEYSAKLENDDRIKFDSIEELLEYENSKEYRMKSLNIIAREDEHKYRNKVEIDFCAETAILSKYDSTIKVSMVTNNVNNRILFKENIEHIFSRHAQDKKYNKLAKSGTFNKISLYFLICTVVLVYQLISSGFTYINKGLLIAVVILLVLEVIKTPLEKKHKELYLPIVFYIGDEKGRYDNCKENRKNFFWTVIVSGTLTIIVGIAGIIVSLL